MPSTINGIGTSYLGKKNLEVREGLCQHCGKEAKLSSYDTRLFFVVVFIPVVPLGKKRVFEQCSRCTYHRAMPLGEYEELTTETLSELEAEHRRKPEDAEAAIAFNSALFEFNQAERAQSHLEELLRTFPDEARVQFYGAAMREQEGRSEEAKRLFDRAYDLDPNDPVIVRAKVIGLVEEGALSQARSLQRQQRREDRDLGVTILIARAYQERADHMAAMEIFREVVNEVPEVAQDKEIRKMVRASEKAMGQSSATLLPRRRLAWGRWATAAVVLAAVIGGGYAYNLYRKDHHELHVVNGYPGELRVVIDGEQEVLFNGAGRQTVRIGEGEHSATVSGPLSEEIPFTIRAGFFERFGSDAVWVLVPGGLGVLAWEETVYTSGPPDQSYEPPIKLHGGTSFLRFDDIDYPFADFPESIEMSSSTSRVTKRRLGELVGDPEEVMAWFFGLGVAGDSLDYLERWIELRPSDQLALYYGSAALVAGETERAAAFLQPRLTVEPVNIEWHRSYQHLLESTAGGSERLLAEYGKLLREHPQSSDLVYLRGRIDPDPRRALALHERALALDPRNLRAIGARGFIHMALGDFRSAVDALRPAKTLDTDDGDVYGLYLDALFAAGETGALSRILASDVAGEPEPVEWNRAARLVEVLCARDRDADAHEMMQRLVARDTEAAGAGTGLEGWLRAHYLAYRGDWAGLEAHLATAELPPVLSHRFAFALAVERGDLEAAMREVVAGSDAGEEGLNQLLVSLLYVRQGITGLSQQWLDNALETLGHSPSHTAFARMVRGELEPTPESLDLLVVEPRLKAVLLTVLGVRYPEKRFLLREAERFNYALPFPHYFLSSFQEGAGA